MLLRTLSLITLFFILTNYSYSASTSTGNTKSNYDKAAKLIKTAKKYETKGKDKKAKKRYERALKYLVKANKEKPNQADTLNYLGFATRKLGDYEKGEKYYLLGLEIDPNHKGINEYLGELYVVTNRIDLAKQRLDVLKNCDCEEYNELKEIIEGKKQSKY
jgi:Flp pilus assembly protein TadD, contains TPR repeats|tara:strand:+ start:801 stop:1283 length:483 start_codon:yes stop_codon:yes gene_type:complete